MPIGPYKPRDPGSLKDAEMALVLACGGFDAAVRILNGRVRRTQLARYTDCSEINENTHMPADVIRTLEQRSGVPVVTRYLAMEAHSLLVSLPGSDREAAYLEDLGKIGEGTGELFRTLTGSLADGVMEPIEAAQVKARVLNLATALGILLTRLDRVIESGGPDT
jgi:hypothetical protein